MKTSEFVNVYVRVKPLLSSSEEENSLRTISQHPAVLLHIERQQTYHFDSIFSEQSSQEEVYAGSVQPLIRKVKDGYNCTVFAYGQTGTGKTYTMGTDPCIVDDEHVGFIPRTLDDFFTCDDLCEDDLSDTEVSVSFIEIYNEKVFDLLNAGNTNPLQVNGFKVTGAKQEKIYNAYDGIHFLTTGGKGRHIGETKQNANSSRSHAIFTIHCTRRHSNGTVTSSKLNLVDLAGSESVRKTGNRGSTFHEGVNINKGLLCIGQVMTALSHNNNHIPYRQSIITSIMKDSLNKKNYVSLIACVSASVNDSNETVQTLEFSQRVKRIRNNPELNHVISEYKKENPSLFDKAVLGTSIKTGLTPFKRPLSDNYCTPAPRKRLKTQPMSSILEITKENNTLDSLKSSFSMSLSSISNCESQTEMSVQQQTLLSPLIKKYMTKMEESLMDKLQTVIENSVRKLSPKAFRKNKENTPGDKTATPKNFSWNEVKGEVSKLVRSEMLEFTAKAARATSSPLSTNTRRVLNYGSPELPVEDYHNQVKSESEPFKIPLVPPVRKIKVTKDCNDRNRLSGVTLARNSDKFSPTYDEKCAKSAKTKRRTSLRLQNKNKLRAQWGLDSSACDLDQSGLENLSTTRQQTILASATRKGRDSPESDLDQSELEHFSTPGQPTVLASATRKEWDSPESDLDQSGLENLSTSRLRTVLAANARRGQDSPASDLDQSEFEYFSTTKQPTILPSATRRSVRLSIKHKNRPVETCTCSVALKPPQTQSRAKKMRPQKIDLTRNNGNSPATTHMKKVLWTLNNGNKREIEKLQCIGTKTSDRIILFRELKGQFKTISDLSNLPGWGEKKYKKFLEQNVLEDNN